MSIDALRHKLAYLSDQVPAPILAVARANFRTQVEDIRRQTGLPQGIWSTVELDLLYGVFRHRIWIKTPILQTVLVEFLATEYRVPQNLGTQLIESQLDLVAATWPTSDAMNDRDFLHYIFIETATAKNESKLIIDLGIGGTLIRKLRSSAAAIMKKSPQASFAAEVDANLSSIMMSVAKEVKETPWALDLHRLRYLLMQHETLQGLRGRESIIFRLLTFIGNKVTLSQNQIINWHKDHAQDISSPESMIKDLVQADLLYLAEQRSNAASKKYALTQVALDITATHYIRSYFHKSKDPLKKLLTLPGSYQQAAVHQLNDPDLMVTLLAEHAIQLTPEGLQAALQQIAQAGKEEACFSIVQKTLRSATNPWLRISALEYLTALKTAPESRSQEIWRAAREDTSALVKRKAALSLIALNEAGKAADLLLNTPPV